LTAGGQGRQSRAQSQESGVSMADKEGGKQRPGRSREGLSEEVLRKERLAKQLRANLAKRKQQQRDRRTLPDRGGEGA